MKIPLEFLETLEITLCKEPHMDEDDTRHLLGTCVHKGEVVIATLSADGVDFLIQLHLLSLLEASLFCGEWERFLDPKHQKDIFSHVAFGWGISFTRFTFGAEEPHTFPQRMVSSQWAFLLGL